MYALKTFIEELLEEEFSQRIGTEKYECSED